MKKWIIFIFVLIIILSLVALYFFFFQNTCNKNIAKLNKIDTEYFKCQAQCPLVIEEGKQELSRECKMGCQYDEVARLEAVNNIDKDCREKSSLIESEISVCSETDKDCLNRIISKYE
jgi:hypothetical protein